MSHSFQYTLEEFHDFEVEVEIFFDYYPGEKKTWLVPEFPAFCVFTEIKILKATFNLPVELLTTEEMLNLEIIVNQYIKDNWDSKFERLALKEMEAND